MKLWEAMKKLTEDPTQEFEAKLSPTWALRMSVDTKIYTRYFKFEVFNGIRVIDQSLGGGAFNGNVALVLDWQLVHQPVTWQEAIQAWADGKMVSYKYPQDPVAYSFQDSNRMMCIEKIKDATWYVED